MTRFICIHAHFYQPPRENPWLEEVELQDSAYPYHDWNERVAAECYGPNAAARILDAEGRIARIVNNYARMSFSMGPPLLGWLERAAPETYAAIVGAERWSQERFGGHGGALSQPYNHVILPLASPREKRVEVRWGVRDFENRFGRAPDGMWLPETAVDLDTLEVLAEHGLMFTILAPHQAVRIRPVGGGAWQDVTGGRIDPTMPYVLRLASGRTIALFFFDGPISQAVTSDTLLRDGRLFGERLLSGFDDRRGRPELVHVVARGETFGHHHRRGEMALAYALQHVEKDARASLTTYGQFLRRQPPSHEVQIVERTSWSCPHDLGRWRDDCGCCTGKRAGWRQGWREPLRAAMAWLRDELGKRFAQLAPELFQDAEAALDDYVGLVLDRHQGAALEFLARHGQRPLGADEQTRALRLLEAQHQALMMFNSSGLSADDPSDSEAVQLLLYAIRALQLMREVEGETGLRAELGSRLALAKSNVQELGDAQRIFDKRAATSEVDLVRVAAHYAVSSLLEPQPRDSELGRYRIDVQKYESFDAAAARVVVGQLAVTSAATLASGHFVFGVLHFGDHNVNAGVEAFTDAARYLTLVSSVSEAAERGDVPELVRLLDRYFGGVSFSVQSLFRDMRRRFLDTMLRSTLTDDEAIYRQLYERHMPLMRFLSTLDTPLPRTFRTAAEVVINSELRGQFAAAAPNPDEIRALLERAELWGVKLDTDGLAFTLQSNIERLAVVMRERPGDLDALQAVEAAVGLAHALPFDIDFSSVQTSYYQLWRRVFVEMLEYVDEGDETAREWAERFAALGNQLGVRVSEMRDTSEMTTVASVVQDVFASARVPRVTYRLQFNPSFTFRQAEVLVPYLRALGISDLYASPILKPRTGSMHGYDIACHSELNPALGTEQDFDALSRALKGAGLGLLLDTVPNHMGIGDAANEWWMDVLENGPSSIYAAYFDVEWHPVKPELTNKVLLPVLEDQYGRVLENAKLRLMYQDGAFYISYYNHRLPLAPRTYALILGQGLALLQDALDAEDEVVQEYQSILTALSYLPLRTETDPARVAERQREKEVVKRRIDALYVQSADVRGVLDTAVKTFNGRVGEPRSFDLLDELIDAQAFRLAFWRVAAEEINYRRFFDVNELAAIRPEIPEVFQATHELVFRFLVEGKVSGLRIDHLDGLFNPSQYLRDLQERFVLREVRSRLEQVRDSMPDDEVLARRVSVRMQSIFEQAGNPDRSEAVRWPLYVVAEKILAEGEALPREWAAAGTTGYDFSATVDGLFVDETAAEAFDGIYARFADPVRFATLVSQTKKMTMEASMASEIYALSHRLERIAEKNRRYRDFTLDSMTFALREVIAGLPVYRTYITGDGVVTARDRHYILTAVAEARKRSPRTAAAIFDFIRDTLMLANLDDFSDEDREMLLSWVRKFQQVTGPVMAKGVEDTAFYVYNRLVSLNEVGGHPEHFGVGVADFHNRNQLRQQLWPSSMLCSSTHDTKRSEDVRARISVLSEMPGAWSEALDRWTELNQPKKREEGGQIAPDRNDEYLLYQTILGAWPMEWTTPDAPTRPANDAAWGEFRERIAAYMNKATKEAKVHTSWVNPNEQYDAAVRQFVFGVLAEDPADDFLRDLQPVLQRAAYFGRFNGLAAAALKLMAPGVPDIYQGTEIWDLSLVDPDNRRPVDFEIRQRLLDDLRARLHEPGEARARLLRELLDTAHDGRVKLLVVYLALQLRQKLTALFEQGSYEPVQARGTGAGHVVAFARVLDEQAVVLVVPRRVLQLAGGELRPPQGAEVWGDTWLSLPAQAAQGPFRNVFTSEIVRPELRDGEPGLALGPLTSHFPIALLERVPEDGCA